MNGEQYWIMRDQTRHPDSRDHGYLASGYPWPEGAQQIWKNKKEQSENALELII